MLELLLLRHAKSARDGSPDEDDHARDLTRRGTAAAARMGRLLREADAVPDLVLCSTATRARRTWELASAELGREVPTRHLRGLYLAAPSRMLEAVRRQDAAGGTRRLLLVGHNPGMHGLARALAAGGRAGGDDVARLEAAFPTAALARFALEGDDWADAGAAGGARLLGYWCPRDLG